MKTQQTIEIERALVRRTQEKVGCYGVLEVTIGHIAGGKGYDRCDYVEFDTGGLITCYEVKVTLSDLMSNNNYLMLAIKIILLLQEN